MAVQLYTTLVEAVLPQPSTAAMVKMFVTRQPLLVSALVTLKVAVPQDVLAR